MDCVACVSSPTATLSFAAGALLTSAWLVFADALVSHAAHDVEPVVTAIYWLPSLLSMFAFAMLAMAPMNGLMEAEYYGFGGGGSHGCSRVWVLCSLTLFFSAIISGVFLTEAMRNSSTSAYSYISSTLLDSLVANATTSAAATTTLANATTTTTVANATTTPTTTPSPTVRGYDDAEGEWYHLYVDYAIIAQTALIFASGGACLMARLQRAEGASL